MVFQETDYAITHALMVTPESLLPDTTIVVRNNLITYIGATVPSMLQGLIVHDAHGELVGPGLIDMHIHGCGGYDSSHSNVLESLEGMALFLVEKGITSFQLATVFDMDVLSSIQDALMSSSFLASHLIGVYVEGPFISPQKKGGIPSSTIRPYDRVFLDEMLSIKHGNAPLITTMTIAPEVNGSEELTAILEEYGVVVAYGHSNCSLETVKPLKKNHITHLFNAMSPIDHRRLGLAALPFTHSFDHATYEMICDGVHVSPSMLDLAFNMLGTSHLCLISDAMSLAGVAIRDGMYQGKEIYSDGKACYYKDDAILIGSSMLINESAKMMYERGNVDTQSFFTIASENPGRVLSLNGRGKIAIGYKADLVMLSNEMEVMKVWKAHT